MPDPNLSLLEEAATKLAPFLGEIVFVGGVTLGLLITDKAAAPIRSTDDVDVIAEILTYVDYIAFSERLRKAEFTEDTSEEPLTCRWFHGKLKLDVLALSKEVLGYTNIWYESALESRNLICFAERPTDQGDHSSLLPGYQDGSIPRTWTDGFPGKPRSGRLCRRDRWKKHDTQRGCRFSRRYSRVSRRSSKKPFERISFSRCGSRTCSG